MEEGETLDLATKEATKEVMIECHAENSEGELAESRSLPVHHLPSFVTISLPSISSEDSEGGKSIVEGGLLAVHCSAVVDNLGKIDTQPLHVHVQPTPTT